MSIPTAPETAPDLETAKILEQYARGSPPAGPEALPPMEVDPPVRGENLWRWLERGFLLLDRLLGRFVPERLNPLLHTSAIATSIKSQ